MFSEFSGINESNGVLWLQTCHQHNFNDLFIKTTSTDCKFNNTSDRHLNE